MILTENVAVMSNTCPLGTKQTFTSHERNGTFQFDLEIPKGKEVEAVSGGGDLVNSRTCEARVVNAGLGFPRQGALMADLFY